MLNAIDKLIFGVSVARKRKSQRNTSATRAILLKSGLASLARKL